METLYSIPSKHSYICRRCLANFLTRTHTPKRLNSSSALAPNSSSSKSEQNQQPSIPQGQSRIRVSSDKKQLNTGHYHNKPPHLKVTDHCFYWDTPAPKQVEISRANSTFEHTKHSPIRWWTASRFRTIPVSSVPEVAFLGRSNVGKSSLLNKLMNDEICYTSKKPGRTREMNAYGVGGKKGGDAKVAIVDMPGYGKASHAEWGQEILKYLTNRKQ